MKRILLLIAFLFLFVEVQAQTNVSSRDSAGVTHYIAIDKLGRVKLSTLSGVPSGASTSTNQTTQIARADSAALLYKTIKERLFQDSYYSYPDSVKGVDTCSFDFGHLYLSGQIEVYNTGASPDTLVFERYSALKAGWTNQAIGFYDLMTNYLEVDNTLIILAATTSKVFKINIDYPGNYRIRPKTLTARTTAKLVKVEFRGILKSYN